MAAATLRASSASVAIRRGARPVAAAAGLAARPSARAIARADVSGRRASLTVVSASSPATDAPAKASGGGGADDGDVPTPLVVIDNTSDAFATVVTLKFGDRLGELLDTVAALKNLGLNIRRAKVCAVAGANTFFITDASTSEKIIKSSRIEEIRVTILQNLIKYHPESTSELAWGDGGGDAREDASGLHVAGGVDGHDSLSPLGKARGSPSRPLPKIRTKVEIAEDPTGSHSELRIETTDRPGLLTSIVGVLKDVSVNVVSAEVDTVGAVAKDTFFVTYHGEPLNGSMCTLVQNSLQYYLSQSESANDESY